MAAAEAGLDLIASVVDRWRSASMSQNSMTTTATTRDLRTTNTAGPAGFCYRRHRSATLANPEAAARRGARVHEHAKDLALERTPLSLMSGLRPSAKDGAADPHMGRAELDRGLKIRAHAHRRSSSPLRAAIFASQREMRRRRLVERRNAHQPGNRRAHSRPGRRAGTRRRLRGRMPAFCGSAPVLISTNSCGGRPCLRFPWPAPRTGLRRSTEWMASNSATASFALLDCSGPIRCSDSPS